jgi:hypothetical protein
MGQSKLKLHKSPAEPSPSIHDDDDALASFAAESDPTPDMPAAPERHVSGSGRKIPYIAAAFGATLMVAAATIAYVATRPARGESAAAAPVVSGAAFIDSRPQGAAIFIDGIAQGITPSKLALPAGQHTLDLKMDGAARSFPLNVEAGTTVSHYIELAASPVKPTVSTGRLEIASDPPGAQVSVNGASRGRTPLTLADIQPGEHVVAISNGSETINRRVAVAAGNTASVFAALGAGDAAAGWVTFKSSIELQIFEAKRLVGTTASDRVMLPAGRHDLELVNTELEFRKPLTVQVGAGTTVSPVVELPNGSLSLNALPWAEVTIDGRPMGTTPLGNVAVPIGTYEIVWRHPQLGERRRTVKVPATTPVRIGVDLNQ